MNRSISRRKFFGILGWAAASGTLLHGKHASAAKPTGTKPNIIFIMADDLGYADLGCYGQEIIKTPYIDSFATESIRFTHCHTGASVCAPSRSVLMTGQHTGHTTVRGNKGSNTPPHDGQKGRIPLKRSDITVAEILKKAGYVTGITGKWGLGEPGSTGLPNDHGFDEWLGYLNQDHAPDYFTEYLWHNKGKMVLEGNKDGKRGQYSHDVLTEFALDFVRQNRSRPFFLYVPYCIPHKKYEIPSTAPYENEPWEEDAKVHAAMITRMDKDVGRILALLKELDIEDNTIVFFCSDNGSARGWGEGIFDSNGPLRGKKGSNYEGGTRTPMIVRWPGKTPVGQVSDAPWYFADIMPTFAEIGGAIAPKNIDGVSVLPTLLGRKQDLGKRYMYWEKISNGRLQQAVRKGNWKAIKEGPDALLELYDLSTDIGESNNIAGEDPGIVAEIEAYLKTARTESLYWPTENE